MLTARLLSRAGSLLQVICHAPYCLLIETPRVPDAILRLALPSPLRRLFDYRAPAGVLRVHLHLSLIHI